jgi:hypothetical protein
VCFRRLRNEPRFDLLGACSAAFDAQGGRAAFSERGHKVVTGHVGAPAHAAMVTLRGGACSFASNCGRDKRVSKTPFETAILELVVGKHRKEEHAERNASSER